MLAGFLVSGIQKLVDKMKETQSLKVPEKNVKLISTVSYYLLKDGYQ